MRRNQIEFYNGLLVIIMNQCALIALAITLMGINSDNTYLPVWIAMTIIPIILHFSRIYIKNFFLFFVLHLLFPAIAILLPGQLLFKIVLMGLVLVYIFSSVHLRVKKKSQLGSLYHPMFVFAIFGLATIYENNIGKKGWEKYYIILAFSFLLFYFIYYFANQYMIFISVNEGSAANIPKREIFNAGMKQTMVFTAGTLVFLLLSLNVEWLGYLSGLLLKIIRTIVKFFFSGAATEEEEDYDPFEGFQETPNMSGMPEVNTEPFLLWIIIENILIAALIIGIISLVAFILVKGVRFLWINFHEARPEKEKKAELEKDTRESCAIESSKKEGIKWFAFLDNRQKIRKIYQKQVLKNKTDIIGNLNLDNLECMTAKECCDKFSADRLKTVYEKARYTEEDITAEDIRLVKSALK